MTEGEKPDRIRAEVLSRLLLLHSVIADLPDTEAVIQFACRGLEGVPGVDDITFESHEHERGGEHGRTTDREVVELRRNGRSSGAISFRIADRAAYEWYEPFVRNLGVVLTVLLEERRQREENERYREQLERLVEQRTQEIDEARRERDRLFQHSMDMFCVATMEGRLLEVNPAWTAVLGWSEDELKNRPFFDLLHPEDMASTGEAANALAEGEPAVGFVNRYRCKDGSYRWMSWNTSAIPEEGLLFGVARDVTSDREAEEERYRLEGLLRESQKMEAIGTLAGGIAHDFNNILGAILGYSELVHERLPIDSVERAHMSEVVAAAKRAQDLTRQILMFSRRSSPAQKAIQVHLVTEEACKLLRSTIPSSVDLRLDIDDLTGTILADPTQIHQVVMNLCTNALHALRDEVGAIEIRLRPMVIGDSEADAFPDLEPGRYAELVVRDTGEGMAPDLLPRIFEPFFSTKGVGKGTGMGLAVVHGIVQSHGGGIKVDSVEGAGTTFRLYLPLVDSVEGEHEPETVPPDRGDGEKILFIDDEPALVEIGRVNLTALGYRVIATTSAREGLELFRADPDAFDLVITDQTMPELRGEELARQILCLRGDTPVLICSGHSATLDRTRALAIGVRDLLAKPVLRKELAVAVRAALDGY